MSAGFVHLHIHSEYSLADGIASIKDLVAAAAARCMPAVSVTDLGNTFALIKFYRAAAAAGVKPIIGVDIWVENGADTHKPYRLILLCQDLGGYRNLCRLVTRAYREGQHAGKPCIRRDWLPGQADGLIVLSGAEDGEIGQALLGGNVSLAQRLTEEYASLFPGRFYLTVQRIGQPYQEDSVHATVRLAQSTNTPLVATNHVCFLHPTDFEAHEVRVCIQDGRVLNDSRRPRRYTPLQYFRSAEEMAELFSDLPEALENTIEIAQRCNLRLEFGRYYLPDYPVPAGMTIDQMLHEQANNGLQTRLDRQPGLGGERRRLYEDRLRHELDVIAEMGFSGYFLIVADFIKWAKNNGIP
ncbi:MAG: PHP domain-containing protein, partial [Acidiferrobacterales bacterium]|nr:PHP domain-containing protein [Acidiferrobacterales bacterium]